MRRIMMLATICLTLASVIAGCATATPGFTKSRRAMAEEFYEDYSTKKRMQKFRHYSLFDQYDIYIFGNQFRHPPAQFLASCFALNGVAAVELLRAKLPDANGDLTVRDIVKLLKTIDAMRMYDVAGDAALMAEATARAAKMKDPGWRVLVEDWLTKMGHERRGKVGFAPLCR